MYKTAIPQILCWVVITVKTTDLQTYNIYIFQTKSQKNKQKKQKQTKQNKIKGMHMLVSWFGTAHRSTAQVSWHISQQTQNLERYSITKLKSDSKFGRYIMIAKEADYFNFFWPYSLSEVIKLPWSIYIFYPILCFSLILGAVFLFIKQSQKQSCFL